MFKIPNKAAKGKNQPEKKIKEDMFDGNYVKNLKDRKKKTHLLKFLKFKKLCNLTLDKPDLEQYKKNKELNKLNKNIISWTR